MQTTPAKSTLRERHWPTFFLVAALALGIVPAMPFVEHATERNDLAARRGTGLSRGGCA